MNILFYEGIFKCMTQYTLYFESDRGNDAVVEKQKQERYYTDILNAAFPNSGNVGRIREFIISSIKITKDNDKIKLSAPVPIIFNFDHIYMQVQSDRNLAVAIVIYFIISDIYKSSPPSLLDIGDIAPMNTMVVCHLVGFSSVCPDFSLLNDLLTRGEGQLNSFSDRTNSILLECSSTLDSLRASEDAMLLDAKERIEAFISNGREELDAAKKAIVEIDKLDSARLVWSKKKSSHLVLAWGGWALLLFFMCFLMYFFLINWQIIKSEVLEPLKNQNSYAYLPVFIIPVIAFGWVLRMFARVVNSSFILADDASQRGALLETYYRLVADKDASMQPGDRILVLNALFRPLPGHQNEDINPPTFADVVGDLLKGKKD